MAGESDRSHEDEKVKTFRWLFYISLFQLFLFFLVPSLIVPHAIIIHLEILASLTVGVLFALYFLGVNICGLFIDTRRRRLYIGMIFVLIGWIVWVIISWLFIERMDYLLH